MLIFRTANINGVEIYGGNPLPPKIKQYFTNNGARVARVFGFVIMYGNFNIYSSDITSELSDYIKPVFGVHDIFGPMNGQRGAVAISASLDISFEKIISVNSFTNFGLQLNLSHLVIDTSTFSNLDIWVPLVDFTIRPILSIFKKILHIGNSETDTAFNSDNVTDNIIAPAEKCESNIVISAVEKVGICSTNEYKYIMPMFSYSNQNSSLVAVDEINDKLDTFGQDVPVTTQLLHCSVAPN